MYRLEWVTVKELESVYTVSATAGKHIQIENRSTFGLSFCKSGKITYTHGGKNSCLLPDRAVILPMGATYTLYNNLGGGIPSAQFHLYGAAYGGIHRDPSQPDGGIFQRLRKIRRLATMHGSRLKMMSLF